MSKTAINRKQEGLVIANIDDTIKRTSDSVYQVKSQNGNGDYDVSSTDLGWVCSCPNHKIGGVKCKHVFAVEISIALRKEVEVARIATITTAATCIYCDSSNIVKDGLRHNKDGDIQKYDCRNRNHYFTINFGLEKMKSSPQTITSALQLYFTGESFRNVQKFLKLQGVKVTHVAILSIERRQWYYCGGGNGAHSISSHGIGGANPNRANATTIPKSEMFFN